jgi:anti-sigma regulatory factor (Ser/Thr protein kinase)
MAMNTTAAYEVHDVNQVGEPRRAVLTLARRLEFSEERAGRAALIVTELATNLVKHARGGEILLRPLSTSSGEADGLEIVALDKGPGIPDFALSRRDGHSTSGTLGHGLGAIERQADAFEMYTRPSGTATVARIFPEARRPRASQERYSIGAVLVSKPGEEVSGDAWSWRARDERLSIMMADGLGHGLHAHEAARACVEVYERTHEAPPATILHDIHAALRSTRGAAVALLAVDVERRTATFAGLGNVAAAILAPDSRQNLVSHNGTAGHTAARIQEFHYGVPQGSAIVMATDGLGTHWDLGAYPGLRTRSATLIAAILYRDFSRRRDDVTVVVAKDRSLLTES